MLFTLALIQFTHVMDFMIIMPMGKQLMEIFQISPPQFGNIVSSYNITAGLVGFAGAFFVDNFDRKKLLMSCYIGFLIGTLACAFAPNYQMMLGSRVLTGAFGGLLSTLMLSIVADAIPLERRASAMGILTSGFALASVFGVPFGSYLAGVYSWHAPFLFIAVIGTLILVAVFVFVPFMNSHITNKANRPDPRQVLVNLAKNLNQRRALFLMSMLMFSQFSIIPFIAPYMEMNVGFTRNEVNLIYLFGGLCAVFTAPLVGRLADKIGRLKVFVIFASLMLIPVFLITNLGAWPVPFVLVITSIFFITVNGRIVPAMAIISSTTEPKTRGSFMSFNSSVQQLSAGIAAFLAGSIVGKDDAGRLLNYNYVGYIALLAGIVVIYAATRIKSTEKPTSPIQVADDVKVG